MYLLKEKILLAEKKGARDTMELSLIHSTQKTAPNPSIKKKRFRFSLLRGGKSCYDKKKKEDAAHSDKNYIHRKGKGRGRWMKPQRQTVEKKKKKTPYPNAI